MQDCACDVCEAVGDGDGGCELKVLQASSSPSHEWPARVVGSSDSFRMRYFLVADPEASYIFVRFNQ